MVTLDFTHCKTKADVDKVYKKHKEDLKIIRDFEKRVLEDAKEEQLDKLNNTKEQSIRVKMEITLTKEISPIEELTKFMHKEYEKIAKIKGWETQKKSRVSWNKLPKENKETMLEVSKKILRWFYDIGVDGHDDFYKYTCIKNKWFEEVKD